MKKLKQVIWIVPIQMVLTLVPSLVTLHQPLLVAIIFRDVTSWGARSWGPLAEEHSMIIVPSYRGAIQKRQVR